MEWQHETQLAICAAIEGGRIATLSGAPQEFQLKESARDIVTPIDLKIDTCIHELLAESGYPVISEEMRDPDPINMDPAQLYWLVDPIDGTANFVNGLEYYAISIGLCRELTFPVGAVCLPRLEQLYCTYGSSRALLNGRHLVHRHRSMQNALVAVSFSGSFADPVQRASEYTLFGQVNDQTRGCLRLGSAAANICFTAAGRLQATYGLNARLWDIAGAMAVAVAAGCHVKLAPSRSRPLSVDYIVGSKDVVATIHELSKTHGLME